MTAFPQQRSLLIVAHFSRYPEALSWSQKELSARFGQVVISSEMFPFEETTFYNRTMGDNLQVQLLCFSELISPEQISLIKNFSNELEIKYKNQNNMEIQIRILTKLKNNYNFTTNCWITRYLD